MWDFGDGSRSVIMGAQCNRFLAPIVHHDVPASHQSGSVPFGTCTWLSIAAPTQRVKNDDHRHDHRGHDHSKMFSTWSYETDQSPALEALRERMRKLPGSVYRAKGVVYTADVPQRRAVLQVVGRRVDISIQEE